MLADDSKYIKNKIDELTEKLHESLNNLGEHRKPQNYSKEQIKQTMFEILGNEYRKEMIDFTVLSDLGLIFRINHEILHPLGMALSRTESGNFSFGCIIDTSPSRVWNYSEETINKHSNKVIDKNELEYLYRLKLQQFSPHLSDELNKLIINGKSWEVSEEIELPKTEDEYKSLFETHRALYLDTMENGVIFIKIPDLVDKYFTIDLFDGKISRKENFNLHNEFKDSGDNVKLFTFIPTKEVGLILDALKELKNEATS